MNAETGDEDWGDVLLDTSKPLARKLFSDATPTSASTVAVKMMPRDEDNWEVGVNKVGGL
jgi:hypothetical protein